MTADLPLVCVVVPSLNRARYLRAAIDSILAQDYPRIECIVRDGGSTDGTREILESYGSLIHWNSAPDGGPFNAINAGWQGSQAPIITWLNADDCWAPGAVTAAVRFLMRYPGVDVVYGNCGVIDADGHRAWMLRAKPWTLEGALLHCDHVIDQPASFLRRTAVERAGWLTPAWLHDQDLWVRMGFTGATFAAIDCHLADSRVYAGNAGSDADRILPLKVEVIERAFANPGLPAHFRGQRRRAISNAHVRGFDSLQPGRPRHWLLGLKTLAAAIRTDPANTPHILLRLAGLVGIFVKRGLRDPRLNG